MVSTCFRGLPAPLGRAVEHVGCPHFSGAGSLLGEHGAAPHLQGDWLPLLRGLEVQGLPPMPFGSSLATEGAPALAAEGLPERFTSPAERPAPSYSSMEEVD
ncbi:hypothetical protein Q9233_006942 [Columba guinea]|nr:hypothetical protein Q9233_006942 [Columba guinea]